MSDPADPPAEPEPPADEAPSRVKPDPAGLLLLAELDELAQSLYEAGEPSA